MPGPLHQQNHTLSHSHFSTLHIILQDLLNICVFHGYHLRTWKRTWAIRAHKPSKRRSAPCSYRPVSLLCGLGKVFEAIMIKRLMSCAENTDKLPTEQSGFRKHHSTNDKLFELTQAVCQAQRLSRRVGAIFLDIEKAFDRVWHNGLRYELLHMNAPALLLRWIPSFLRNRTVKVRILGNKLRSTMVFPKEALSPSSLPMSKPPKLLPNTRRSLFADDFMIYTESSITRTHHIQSNLQTSMDALTSDHRIILSCTKSVRVFFERRKSNRLKPQDVSYNGRVIPSSSSVKFIGIAFDSALTFRSHFRTVATLHSCPHRLLKLNSIFSTIYGPSTSTLILLYKSYIHSLFVYGAPATCVASPAIQLKFGEDTNSFHFANTFQSILHPHRQKTAARLPSIHLRQKPVPSQTLKQARGTGLHRQSHSRQSQHS